MYIRKSKSIFLQNAIANQNGVTGHSTGSEHFRFKEDTGNARQKTVARVLLIPGRTREGVNDINFSLHRRPVLVLFRYLFFLSSRSGCRIFICMRIPR